MTLYHKNILPLSHHVSGAFIIYDRLFRVWYQLLLRWLMTDQVHWTRAGNERFVSSFSRWHKSSSFEFRAIPSIATPTSRDQCHSLSLKLDHRGITRNFKDRRQCMVYYNCGQQPQHSRGVWEHAPPEKSWIWDTLKVILVTSGPFLILLADVSFTISCIY